MMHCNILKAMCRSSTELPRFDLEEVISQKTQASCNAPNRAASFEYLKDSTIDLGRLLATMRTFLASWTLVAAFSTAMLLAPVVIPGADSAEVHARHAAEMVLAHKVWLERGLRAPRTALTSKGGESRVNATV